MKALKKTLILASVAKDGSKNASAATCKTAIRLKGVTVDERKNLRIPSYSYLLP